jgi:hypothetical protein
VLLAAVVVALVMARMSAQAHPTAKKLLCCGLGGITGSWIYAIRWYVKAVTGKLWSHDFIVWRLTAPFVGIFLSVSTYVIMETGLLGVTFNKNGADPNTYAYAIGFLVGLFSDDVMKKLAEVAKTVFGKATTDDTKPGLGHATTHMQGVPSGSFPVNSQAGNTQLENKAPAPGVSDAQSDSQAASAQAAGRTG